MTSTLETPPKTTETVSKVVETSTGTTPASTAAASKPKPKGYTNPAFKAMGIPALRLPSRNWMIFWTVLAGTLSGVAYDKYEQKKLRKKWTSIVAPMGEKPWDTHTTMRKITIFVAPPPDDYLEETLKVFRRYVKPVLYASCTDFEVVHENKQGIIRHEVAERVRKLRREILEHEATLATEKEQSTYWSRLKNWWSPKKEPELSDAEREKIEGQKYKAEFDYQNLLGVYYKNRDDQKVVSEDAMNVDTAGGVICIGRGAFKEYMEGLHEGILGPLEEPKDIVEVITPVEGSVAETVETTPAEATPAEATPAEATPAEATLAETTEKPEEELDEDGEPIQKEAPKPWILRSEFATAEIPRELDSPLVVDPKTNIPALYQQPVLVLGLPSLTGFLNIPRRIYRFYTRRYFAEEVYSSTAALVFNVRRPFTPEDANIGMTEEHDWPSSWKKRAIANKGLWVEEIAADERILSRMSVFDPSQLQVNDQDSQ